MKKNWLATALIFTIIFSAAAQHIDKKIITAENYKQATKFLSFNTSKLVYNNNVDPVWMEDGKFWYSITTVAGKQFI